MNRRARAWVMAAVITGAGLGGIGVGSAANAEPVEPALEIEYGSQDGYGYPDDDYGYPPPTDYYYPPTETPTPPPTETPTPPPTGTPTPQSTEIPSPSTSPTPLPETGSGSLSLIGVGMGLIALGLVAWLLAGRRRARA